MAGGERDRRRDGADQDSARDAGARAVRPSAVVTPTNAGSAKTASVNSSQQSRLIAARDASIARMIMVVASVWKRSDGRAFHHHHGAAEI